ncbi:hypothetical protein BHE74_00009477 [Ensete ventricosum]|nr:hypothetical protein BHE74_00009477 [Ensete ventricosum]RZR89145.1 hypothetical protein BHM03_00016813 [Ensete ventricosum]
MSFASSHFKSRSVKILAHRSRVLSRPSGDSVSVVVVLSSSASGDSGTTDVLAAMRSFFNVDSTVTTRRLVEVRKNYFIPPEYELHVPLPGEHPYDAFTCGFSLSTATLEAGLRFSLHPVIDACLKQWRISPSQMTPNSFPTERTSRTMSIFIPVLSPDEIELVEILWGILSVSRGVKYMNEAWLAEAGLSLAFGGDAGVSTVEKRPSSRVGAGLRKCLRKVPEPGYTMRELCEVEDRAGADKYFASIMTRLKCVDSEDPLVSRWSTISESSPFWTEGPLSKEYLWGALRPILTNQELVATAERRVKELEGEIEKIWTELESLRSQRRELEQEVGLLCSNLDGARNDQARLESDVLSLIEVATFLEAKLKAKSQKTMAAYKASRGFESGLEKMGRVSYEFRYRVASDFGGSTLILCSNERDPFPECSEDANIEMDLD